jgi:phosphate/sulfate permease
MQALCMFCTLEMLKKTATVTASGLLGALLAVGYTFNTLGGQLNLYPIDEHKRVWIIAPIITGLIGFIIAVKISLLCFDETTPEPTTELLPLTIPRTIPTRTLNLTPAPRSRESSRLTSSRTLLPSTGGGSRRDSITTAMGELYLQSELSESLLDNEGC